MPTARKTSTAKPAARKATARKAATKAPAAPSGHSVIDGQPASRTSGRKAATKAAPAKAAPAKAAPATALDKAANGNAYIAGVVRAAREAAGLSTGELAERMSTSDGAVRRIEDGRANCTVATLANVAQALDRNLVVSFA